MSTIRRLYSDVTQVLHRGTTHDAGISAAAGFALGMAHKHLKSSTLPIDALGGAIVMYAGSFGPSAAKKYLGGDTVRQAAEAAIAVGMARVGEQMSGAPRHHGEFGAVNDSGLLREAERL